MNMLDEARMRGLIEDKPDGGIRMLPELEEQMPELYEIIMQAQLAELDQTLLELETLGLIEPVGVDADGMIAYQLTEIGKTLEF